MFILELYDRIGNKLNEGDFVKISDGKKFTFYSEVKFLENEMAIAPFHTFSFHSIEKVDKVPDEAIKGKEERYDMWYHPDPQKDNDADSHERYLIDWRDCERLIEKGNYRIRRA